MLNSDFKNTKIILEGKRHVVFLERHQRRIIKLTFEGRGHLLVSGLLALVTGLALAQN
jgi:hypothetical protein